MFKKGIILFSILISGEALSYNLVSLSPSVDFDKTHSFFVSDRQREVFAGLNGTSFGVNVQIAGIRWKYVKAGLSVAQVGNIPLYNSSGESIGSIVPRGIVGFGGVDWTVGNLLRVELVGKVMVEDLVASVGKGFGFDAGVSLDYSGFMLGGGVKNAGASLEFETHSEKLPMEYVFFVGKNFKVNAYSVGVESFKPVLSVNYSQNGEILIKGNVSSRMVMSEHLVFVSSGGVIYSLDTVSPFVGFSAEYRKFKLGVFGVYNINLGLFSFSTFVSFCPDGFVSLDDLNFLLKRDEFRMMEEESSYVEEEAESEEEIEQEEGEVNEEGVGTGQETELEEEGMENAEGENEYEQSEGNGDYEEYGNEEDYGSEEGELEE